MHLEIKQANDRTEQVSSTCIDKLYNLSKNGLLDATSDLRGSINAASAYEDAVTFLNTMWGPNLIVTASAYYIRFADPEVESVLKTALSKAEDEGITTQEAAAFNSSGAFSGNTGIVSFNELRYFTKCNTVNMPSDMFLNCSNLESVDITNTVKFGYQMFRNCTKLAYFHGENSTQGELRIPYGTTLISQHAFRNCACLTSVSIPPTVASIADDVFNLDNNINSVNIEDLDAWLNIDFVDGDSNPASYSKNLYLNGALITSVDFTGYTSIKKHVLCGLELLTSVILPNTLTSIGDGSFNGCSSLYISDINLPNLTFLGSYAFRSTKIGQITNLGSITSIGNACFLGISTLTSVILPNTVTSIGSYAFRDSSLTQITLPNSITYIGNTAFGGMPITSITIPPLVTVIELGTFFCCTSLQDVTLPSGITTIGTEAFQECRSLPTLVLPQTVTTIGTRAFTECRSMSSLIIEATTPPTIGDNLFRNNNCTIYVPASSVSAYQSASGWSTYANRIQAIPTT